MEVYYHVCKTIIHKHLAGFIQWGNEIILWWSDFLCQNERKCQWVLSMLTYSFQYHLLLYITLMIANQPIVLPNVPSSSLLCDFLFSNDVFTLGYLYANICAGKYTKFSSYPKCIVLINLLFYSMLLTRLWHITLCKRRIFVFTLVRL